MTDFLASGIAGHERHQITREIGIDMGHRVTFHGSKCKNIHGHRYRILATCEGPLALAGEQQGMVIDFGFLKEEMMAEIDYYCDHGLVLWIQDPLLETLPGLASQLEHIKGLFNQAAGWFITAWDGGKLYLLDAVPTAENLARHWFDRLTPRVHARTMGRASLTRIRVWETPQCYADYPGGPGST